MNRYLIVVAVLAALLSGCQTTKEIEAPVTAEQEAPAPVAAEPTTPVEAVVTPPVVVEEPVKEKEEIMILMKTSMGDIKLELDAEKAPKTVANFMKYVEAGHYNDVIFHRIINNFMIQGGGFDANMNQKKAPHTVENEAANGLKNDIGTIAMARTADPHSGGAQFFINVKDNDFLNYPGQDGWGYCVFGKVTEGMDVVNEIKAVKTARGDVPVEPVMIESITVVD